MTLRIGIDLGTTYSLAAYVLDGVPRLIDNAVGSHLTPSAVFVAQDGTILIGEAARARAITDPERTATAFKRDMGTGRVYELSGRRFTPEELSALVLGELKRDAEAAFGEPVVEAVVTVPAYFGNAQRQATRAACEIAGLHVERVINEPTAAALAYGLHERHREFKAVVLDLGGGTFDVTVLEIMEGVIEIQASAGDTRLGGEDFLDAIVQHVSARLRHEHGLELAATAIARARLRDACEHAKKRLSSAEQVPIVIPELPTKTGPRDIELLLDRSLVEREYEPLVQRLAAPIERALRDAGCTPASIDEVLLVGGATRMPCVARLATQMFGRLPLRSLPADEAVALGAAVQVASKSGEESVADLVVTDVAPFTLGIATGSHEQGALVTGMFSPIIERGTVLPASRVEHFSTLASGQHKIQLEVYQGEHSLCEKNQKIAEYELTGIPKGPAGQEVVEVRFTYDMNGVLDIDATIVSTGKTATFTVAQTSGRLSQREIDATRARLAKLKFHPRDALPNATALARADALHVRLTGPARAELARSIQSFRAALEAQDPAAIEHTRRSLLSYMADCERA